MNRLKSPSRAKTLVANPYDKRSNNRGKFETARTSSQTQLKRVPNFFGVIDKIYYTKTPIPKLERVVPGRVGVVTNTSVHSNESKKSSTQLTIVQLKNIKRKLEFPNNNPINTRKNKLASKSSMKSSKKQSKEPKLKLHEIDWTDPKQLRDEVGNYETNNTTLLTQETIIPFLLNQLTAASIKMAFLMLIGRKQ